MQMKNVKLICIRFLLYTLIIFSSLSAANKGRRTSYDIVKQLATRGNIDPKRENNLKRMIEKIQEEDPDFTLTFEDGFDVQKAITDIYYRFLNIGTKETTRFPGVRRDALTELPQNMQYPYALNPTVEIRRPTKPTNIQHPYALDSLHVEAIAEVLIGRIGEQNVPLIIKTNLIEIIQTPSNVSRVGESLLELAKVVNSVHPEDIAIILIFINSIRNIYPARTNDNNLSAASVLMELAEHIHKIPFYESAHTPPTGLLRLDVDRLDTEPLHRDQLMGVLYTFNEKFKMTVMEEDMSILPYLRKNDVIRAEDALNLALIKHIITTTDINRFGLLKRIQIAKQQIRDVIATFDRPKLQIVEEEQPKITP